MGRGEGPVQRRHRRQLCERVQYVRERVSGKSVRRRVPGGRGGGAWEDARSAPIAAAPGSLPARVVQPPWAVTCPLPRGHATPPTPCPARSSAAGTLPGRRALVPGSRRAGWGARGRELGPGCLHNSGCPGTRSLWPPRRPERGRCGSSSERGW